MSPLDLPAHLIAFLAQYIHSIEQLEILLFMAREPGKVPTASDVYGVLLTSPQSIGRWLEKMATDGLLARSHEVAGGYGMSLESPFAALVAELGARFRETPMRVIEAVYHGGISGPHRGFHF